MSESNLQKQLDRFETEFHLGRQTTMKRKAFLISDSKGKYLKKVVNRGENILKIFYKKGASSNNDTLRRMAKDAVRGEDSPLLLVWTGTCDFTDFDTSNRTISLNGVSVPDVLDRLRKFRDSILEVNPSTEFIFLQCPHFSIKLWNESLDETVAAELEDDEKLFEKIDQLNNELDSLNADISGPRFSLDLYKNTRVRRGRERNSIKTKSFYNFGNLYTDGIHPIPLLAEVWLRKLQQIVIQKCY